MHLRVVIATLAVAIPAVGAPASAQPKDPKFEFGKAADVEKVKTVEWHAQAELGIVFTTGNSENTTISGGLKADRKTGANKLSLEASLTYAQSGARVLNDLNGNGTIDAESEITSIKATTAETMAAKLRYDRFLTAHNSLFLAALAARDLPAGKEKVLGVQAGYSRQLFKTKTSEAVAEIGYDFSNEDLVTGKSLAIHSARGFLGYKSEMTEGANLDASIEMLTNLNKEELQTEPTTGKDGGIGKDTRINSRVAIAAKIGKGLQVQTSIEVRYDHRPGPLAVKGLAMGFVPEASALDTIMKASLIYSFF